MLESTNCCGEVGFFILASLARATAAALLTPYTAHTDTTVKFNSSSHHLSLSGLQQTDGCTHPVSIFISLFINTDTHSNKQ